MIIRHLFFLPFWLHYSSKPGEGIKITRRYSHSIQKTYWHNRHGLAQNRGCPCGQASQKLQNLVQNGYCTYPSPSHPLPSSRTGSTGTQLANSTRGDWWFGHWPPTDLVLHSLHSVFLAQVLCRMPSWSIHPILVRAWHRLNCWYGERVTEQLLRSLCFTFDNKLDIAVPKRLCYELNRSNGWGECFLRIDDKYIPRQLIYRVCQKVDT